MQTRGACAWEGLKGMRNAVAHLDYDHKDVSRDKADTKRSVGSVYASVSLYFWEVLSVCLSVCLSLSLSGSLPV